MNKKVVCCCILVGLGWLAVPVGAADLKAYYEREKKALVSTFSKPELGSTITVTLLDGQEKTGKIKQLTKNGVQLLSEGALVTFSRHKLKKESCAQLFAEDYAEVEALKRTRAYKRSLSASLKSMKQPHRGSLSVGVKTKKDETNDRTIDNGDDGTMTKETKKLNRVQELTISVLNPNARPEEYTLEWYFFAQQVKKEKGIEVGDHKFVILDQGSAEIKLGARQKVKRKVSSGECILTKTTFDFEACCGRSTVTQYEKGQEMKGYLVILKSGDKVLARKASSKRYLKPDWVKMCR